MFVRSSNMEEALRKMHEEAIGGSDLDVASDDMMTPTNDIAPPALAEQPAETAPPDVDYGGPTAGDVMPGLSAPATPAPMSLTQALGPVFGGMRDMAQMPIRPGPESIYNSPVNELPVKLPPGLTQIHPADMPRVVMVLADSFPSMSETGIVLDVQERSAFAISVMSNMGLRSDIKAQLIDSVMRNGKIVPEALSTDWYQARNINLRPFGQRYGQRI